MRKALFFLSGLLSPFREGGPAGEAVEDQDWRLLTWLAGCYLVTPSLAWRVKSFGLMERLPAEVSAELQEIAVNVTQRNRQFRAQLTEIAAAFDAASLSCVVLKGAAYLLAPVYPTPFMRVMADIDLLVDQQRLDEACAILTALGYRQIEDQSLQHKPAAHRHLNPFVHPSRIAAVELHRAALPAHLDACAPVEELLATRRRYSDGARSCYTLAPTFRVLNLIMHAEIVDYGYVKGLIPVRALEEFAYNLRGEAADIDWNLLLERFDALGRRHVLLAFLLFAQRLFGVPLPAAVSGDRLLRPRLHYRRCLLQFGSPVADRWLRRWSRLSATYVSDRFGAPAGFGASTGKRMSLIAKALRRRRERQ